MIIARKEYDRWESERILKMEKQNKTPFQIGKAYFIRTVTYHLTGRVTAIAGNFLMLEQAAWIADSGPFMQAIQKGKLFEVEPVGEAMINMGAIVDAFPWPHDLPVKRK